MKPLYTAIVTVSGGRDGKAHAAEPPLALALATPQALGGPGGAATNPEQHFAAGDPASFESALRQVARLQKRPLDEAAITAHVTLG
jgi:organic hydroperoxide reductase OsmC/OhrA